METYSKHSHLNTIYLWPLLYWQRYLAFIADSSPGVLSTAQNFIVLHLFIIIIIILLVLVESDTVPVVYDC